MRFPRPSRTTTGSLTHLISRSTVEATISDALPLTQDGGNSSEDKELKLSMIKERS
jgi:hypothetical protein